MILKKTPIATFVSSIVLITSTNVGAAGGETGVNGANYINGSGAPIDATDRTSYGKPGDVSGGSGDLIQNKQVSNATLGVGAQFSMTGAVGMDGGDSVYGQGGAGAGAGGVGGGSVWGGISIGGAGGVSTVSGIPANGGAGGDIIQSNIELSGPSTITGAAGGKGGSTGFLVSGGAAGIVGGAGVGGNGGGSIVGGISTGGAGGGWDLSSAIINAMGGVGGSVSNSHVTLQQISLDGSSAAGGKGGDSINTGGGGAAGHGGGSVFGGISTGGAGGNATDFVDGGAGGDIAGSTIRISNASTFTGAAGGQGGASRLGAGGAAGHGGGSVFGGISTGGAGGYSSISEATSSSRGGAGGNISDSVIDILGNSALIGADGGKGGSTSVWGGGGAAGHGGGSVFGGISIGGAGGGSDYSISPSTGISFISTGGSGGSISGSRITLENASLNGSNVAGGQGGDSDVMLRGLGGGGGAGGHGGGSVFGGISAGGAGGYSYSQNGSDVQPVIADGGAGGDISSSTVMLKNLLLDGSNAAGGKGGVTALHGATGASGHGGGSIFGGISTGGAGGVSNFTLGLTLSSAAGGAGGDVSASNLTVENVMLKGGHADGGQGSAANRGGDGAAGHGGGSIFGGLSTGGAGGTSLGMGNTVTTAGGVGGDITGSTISILGTSSLDGGAGGQGVQRGAAGHGGGSIFGGISTGGAGGNSSNSFASPLSADGGAGGNISSTKISLVGTLTLTGSGGGNADAGAAGHGGGSIFGGISTGGAGGFGYGYGNNSANGGIGGSIRGSIINISGDITLTGGAGGQNGAGTTGYGGGSIFGGISSGGAGGNSGTYSTSSVASADGGAGGNVTNNSITLSGNTSITGSVYGGLSQGGAKGNVGFDGKGGLTNLNTITLIGDNIAIGGSLYGGLSINGDKKANIDETYSSYYAGNTLNVQSGHFLLKGSIENFQNYNWFLPEDEFDGDVIITVDTIGNAVDINNTVHRVDVQATGNTLKAGDKVVLISQAFGVPALQTWVSGSKSRLYIEQGFFIVYDATMDVEKYQGNDALVLNVLGITDGNAVGKIHPESEEFLKGRIAQLAMVDQGADMISDGISYARASLRKENANIFAIVDGGSSKYKNGGVSTLKLNDFKVALGAAKAWEFEGKSVGMIAAFAEYGNGNYSSYNYFDYFEDTRGSGKVRYSGVGLMGHLDVAGTDVSKVKNKPNIFDDKYGLYLDAALRVGHVKVDFHSADMVNGAGVEARYNTKSRYASAMLGAGYVWTLDDKSALDFYGRFTFSRMNGKDIQVVDEQMNAGPAHSKRLRVGARYGYAYSATTTPYAGVAFERNFTGDVTGSAYGFTIKETSLKGNTGIVEAGVMIKPKGADDPFSLRLGVQGHFGQRKGATADVRARYVF